MKALRLLAVLGGLVLIILAFGFIFQIPGFTSLWPWADGRYSYLFIGSILAAISAAVIWIGWTGEWGALPGGALNVFVIGLTTAIYFLKLSLGEGHSELTFHGTASLVSMLLAGAAYLWSRRIHVSDGRPMPRLVKISFLIFMTTLFLAAGALILRLPIFPWKLHPDSSVIFGCVFLGNAVYFLYGLLHPRWVHASGQLMSFLAYDLVLILPFLALIPSVAAEFRFNLIVYILILVYSGALAVIYLFLNPQTRFNS